MMTKTEKKAKIEEIISYACMGANEYIRHAFSGIIFTDNVKAIADVAGAYWLIDAICSYRKKEEFQVWELTVNPDNSAVLTMKEDSNTPVLVRQQIPFTDFPIENIKFYIELGSIDCVNPDYVLMLPNER